MDQSLKHETALLVDGETLQPPSGVVQRIMPLFYTGPNGTEMGDLQAELSTDWLRFSIRQQDQCSCQIAIGRASRPFPRSKRSRPWDRLPARYLPARLQQPSPKLGMELSPHHSFPEVTVGVVPAPAHHVRFLRTLSSSCLPSPCLRLSRGPWSGITPTSTMQAP